MEDNLMNSSFYISKEELERRTELEEETIEDILAILRSEFE